MISLDSNILAYAADNMAGARHLQATEILRSAREAGAVLTEQSLFELLNYSTLKAKRSMPEALAVVDELAANFRVIYPPLTIVDDVIRLLRNYKLNVWDARILAVCAANGCEILLSEDMQDGAVYDTVRLVNPFNPKNAPFLRETLNQ